MNANVAQVSRSIFRSIAIAHFLPRCLVTERPTLIPYEVLDRVPLFTGLVLEPLELVAFT